MHVGLVNTDARLYCFRPVGQLAAKTSKHARGRVYGRDLMTRLGNRNCDASGSARKIQDTAPRDSCLLHEPENII